MKVVAFNGSPRKGGNTEHLIKATLAPIEAAGIETEIIKIGGKAVRGCIACRKCFEKKDGTCAIKTDDMNEWIAKLHEADGIILGSPTYFTDVTAEMKAFIDRAGYVAAANGRKLTRKVGASVVAVRRGGATHVYDTMNHFMMFHGMIVPGSTYWNIGYGLNEGDVANDAEGMNNMRDLGENIAWLLQKING